MTTTSGARVACPTCNRRYRWAPQHAGKYVKCKCGQTIEVPLTPEAPESPAPAEAEAEVVVAEPQPAAQRRPAHPLLKTALPTGGAGAVEKALQSREDDARESPFLDRQLPVIMIALGVALTYGLCIRIFSTGHPLQGAGVATMVVAVQLLLFVPLALFAASTGARLMGISFGDGLPMFLKLVAITLGPGAIADALLFGLGQLDFDTWHPLVGLVFYFIFCGVPLWLMFKLDFYETCLVCIIQAVPRVGLLFGLVAVVPHVFGKLTWAGN